MAIERSTKQQRFRRGPVYEVTGKSGGKRKVKCVGRFQVEADDFVLFRTLRKKGERDGARLRFDDVTRFRSGDDIFVVLKFYPE